MNRRLRKKKCVGEFQEFGFYVGFRFALNLGCDERNCLLDRFITDAIEANDLQFGGGGTENEWTGCAGLDKRGSAIESHCVAVEEWMLQEPLVNSYCIGPLIIDMWRGNSHDPPRSSWKEKASSRNKAVHQSADAAGDL